MPPSAAADHLSHSYQNCGRVASCFREPKRCQRPQSGVLRTLRIATMFFNCLFLTSGRRIPCFGWRRQRNFRYVPTKPGGTGLAPYWCRRGLHTPRENVSLSFPFIVFKATAKYRVWSNLLPYNTYGSLPCRSLPGGISTGAVFVPLLLAWTCATASVGETLLKKMLQRCQTKEEFRFF